MKTLLKSFVLLTAVIIAFASTSQAQTEKSFKGIVTFSRSYTGNIDAATMAQMPKLMTISVLGNLQKLEIASGPYTMDFISNGDKKESLVLIDAMGQKMYYKSDQAEIESDYTKNGTPEITYSDETKTIAGYSCKKAEYITKDADGNEQKVVVYYTEELGGEALNYGTSFQGLKGFPLEYVGTEREITITSSATEVKKGKVKDTDFMVPTDYVECTPDIKAQMKAAFNGEE
jgi:GLPGLI family protein